MTTIAGHQPKTLPSISAGADEMLSYMHQQIQRAVADASSQMKRLQQRNAELEGELQASRLEICSDCSGDAICIRRDYGERVLTCYEAWRSHLGSNLPGVHLNFINPQPVPVVGAPPPPIYAAEQQHSIFQEPLLPACFCVCRAQRLPLTASGSPNLAAHGAGVDRRDPDFAEKCKVFLKTAIEVRAKFRKAGFRHFGTAELYRQYHLNLASRYPILTQNIVLETEQVLDEAIRESGIPRESFFVTTNSRYITNIWWRSPSSLKNLGMDYVDLYLMHAPQTVPVEDGNLFPLNADGTLKTVDRPTFNESYAEMKKLLATGKSERSDLTELLTTAKVVPAVNQVELHPYLAQNDLVEFHRQKGIATEAYSATATKSELIQRCTYCAKHGVSATQVILGWHQARGVIIVTRSTNAIRQKENLHTSARFFLPFIPTLDEEDMLAIAKLDRGERINASPDKNGIFMGWTAERLGW
ncbi:NADP-dependent oxidoreductase domain-containing protein [Mucidula mucida]|nr:NADP-dependent oxidoreductase domain-containing protein [Mucidula mucida]